MTRPPYKRSWPSPDSEADIQELNAAREAFRNDVLKGLSQRQKTLPCKHLYDARGSQLFDAICELPEYYPTRTEIGLLRAHARGMAAMMGDGAHLVEFGSGSSVKVRILLDAAPKLKSYVPVDISRDHLLRAAAAIAKDYPHLPVYPVCADFTRAFPMPVETAGGRLVGFFPGSTIGNFAPEEAVAFLAMAAKLLGPGGGLLIGADLKKDVSILQAAYDDPAGVTAAFNLNLLRRINRELGGTFDSSAFRHEAIYNASAGCMEMYLVSRKEQAAKVAGQIFRFADGERIHTENSHKYGIEQFQDMAAGAGFEPGTVWTDEQRLFSLHFLTVRR